MAQLFANNASNTLAAEISAVATSMTLNDADAFPEIAGDDWYLVTLVDRDIDGNEDDWEIVKVTGKASDTLTIVRAQEGTTARIWAAGTPVDLRLTAASVESPENLGSAAYTESTDYATASQGSTADTAVQPGDTIPIADGGTGATTAAAAQTALIGGSSEIGADLADGDHIPVIDATDSTAKKSLMSRVYDYVRSKLLGVANTWAGVQTFTNSVYVSHTSYGACSIQTGVDNLHRNVFTYPSGARALQLSGNLTSEQNIQLWAGNEPKVTLTSDGDVGIGLSYGTPSAKLDVNGYTKLGESAPAIKCKKLTGVLESSPSLTILPHGVNRSKIISMTALATRASSGALDALAVVDLHAGINDIFISHSDTNFNSQPFTVLIWYEE